MSSPETRQSGRHRAPRRNRFTTSATVLREAGPGAVKASVTLVAAMGVAASLGLSTLDSSATAAAGSPQDTRTAGAQADGATVGSVAAPGAPLAAASFGLSGFTAKAKPLDPVSPEGVEERIKLSASRGVDYQRKGLSYEGGMMPNAIAVANAVRANFPSITTIGGYRPGDPLDHGSGHAADIMCNTAEGDAVAAFFQANAAEYNIKYIIWRQRIWYPGSSSTAWRGMADRGSITQNHYDHVHVSVN